MSVHNVSIELQGKTYSLETGKLAKFANGSVVIRSGDTMVLVTSVASDRENPELDYLPLQVEYREKFAAAGKFPGGFLKREGRPSDHEVLNSRLIDRPIRPLIPKGWRFETQIIANVFSFDPDCPADVLAAIGSSASLLISDIPFEGPISEVKVGRIDGEFVLNPPEELLKDSDIDLTVSGSDTSINMVEGESKEISEEDFLAALEFAHENIRSLNDLQRQLLALTSQEKRTFEIAEIPVEIVDFVNELISSDIEDYIHKVTTKKERQAIRKELKKKVVVSVVEKFIDNEDYEEAYLEKTASEVLGDIEKKLMRKMILKEHRRLDGRELNEIRNIDVEVGVLARSHGSALFTRGETQSLTTVTLGTKHDEKMVDGLLPVYSNKFYLHYNFPPFCTGEVKRLGTGRREIGHGNLAERALKGMYPEEEFPYTVRVVSEILESNGSSSMATVCAGSLALFDAGVPLKKPIAGIAMGLIKEGEDVAILSDILGDEDHLGDMDFKVTGSVDGITACQMDIKIEGLSIDIMKQALSQAREGRLHILSVMNALIDSPREDISPYAPRFTILKIPTDAIGAVIGSGGENIKHIVAETGADINIEDDGTVIIATVTEEAAKKVVQMIEECTKQAEEGEVYSGVVKDIKEGIGAIVEFMPKKQGLLHISQIAYERVENVSDVLNVGDKLEVKLLEITRDGKFRLSRRALLPKPEGWEERKPQRRPDQGGQRRYNNDRGGDRGGQSRSYDDRGGQNRDRGGDRGGQSRGPRR